MLFSPSSPGVSAPLFYSVLVVSVLGFGMLFDSMALPAGARSVQAVELALSHHEASDPAWLTAGDDLRMRRRPS